MAEVVDKTLEDRILTERRKRVQEEVKDCILTWVEKE